MTPKDTLRRNEGFSLTEVMVVTLLVAALAGGIYTGTQTATAHSRTNRHRTTAMQAAHAKLEQLRNRDFFRVQALPGSGMAFVNTFVIGTNDAYLASEDLLQQEQVRLNPEPPGSPTTPIMGNLTVWLEDVDDAWDGLGPANTDLVALDYKRLRAEVTWQERGRTLTEQVVTLFTGETGFDVLAPPTSADEAGQLADVQKPAKSSAPKGKAKPGQGKKDHVPDANGD